MVRFVVEVGDEIREDRALMLLLLLMERVAKARTTAVFRVTDDETMANISRDERDMIFVMFHYFVSYSMYVTVVRYDHRRSEIAIKEGRDEWLSLERS